MRFACNAQAQQALATVLPARPTVSDAGRVDSCRTGLLGHKDARRVASALRCRGPSPTRVRASCTPPQPGSLGRSPTPASLRLVTWHKSNGESSVAASGKKLPSDAEIRNRLVLSVLVCEFDKPDVDRSWGFMGTCRLGLVLLAARKEALAGSIPRLG